MIDPKRGLVPDAEVRAEWPDADPLIAAAVADAKAGNWQNAANLVDSTWGDWDRRATVVEELADVAAHDDTWLKAWRAARPDDPGLAVVDAQAWLWLAWAIRGARRAKDTTEAQFAGFHRVLAKAEEVAMRVTEAVPQDPTPWLTLVTLARGLSYEHEQFQQVWKELVTRAPLHRYGHDQAMQYWCAKWRGSHELMVKFADEAAAKSPELAVLPLQAAFEMESDDKRAWQRPGVRSALDMLLGKLQGQGVGTKRLRNERGLAILALFDNGRYREAVEQFRELGPYADALPWSYYEDPRAAFLDYRAKAVQKA